MATYTPNYNLEKPDGSDQFGDFRTSYNSNMDIIDANLGGGGGGGGHTIVDPNGNTMPNRSKLKFTGSVSVTDDSANNQTVVDITGGGGELYLNNGLIGSDSGVYVTCNLDKTLENGFYLVRVFDSSNSAVGFYEMKWEGTSQTLSVFSSGQLLITSTTAGLTYYSGAWRNIYCDILSLGGSGGGSGDTVSWTQIQATGEKIAEITINGTTTDVLIPFEAKIIVTTTTGLTVTATKGGTTYTATETSTGVYEVTVDSKGTWTVTDGTNTTTVNVTAQTTYNVAFVVIPDGSTVTPTDDIQILLHCANIWDKAYTTIGELLADSTTLSAVISDNNAIDYLVRSTTWASSVTSDSSAMTYIGLNNYASNTLLANSTWLNAICNSAYIESVLNVKNPTMTDNTHPSGVASASNYDSGYEAYKAFDNDVSTFFATQGGVVVNAYLSYTFASTQKIFFARGKFRVNTSGSRTFTVKYQGSNDNFSNTADLTDLFTYSGDSSSGAILSDKVFSYPDNYLSYRIICTAVSSATSTRFSVIELTFYGREDV